MGASEVLLRVRPEHQSARMSKITNDGLTRSDIGCFIAVVPIWQQWASKVNFFFKNVFTSTYELRSHFVCKAPL